MASAEGEFGVSSIFAFKISNAVQTLRNDLQEFEEPGNTPDAAQMTKIHKDEKALDKAVENYKKANE
jgi:hypothetical protein